MSNRIVTSHSDSAFENYKNFDDMDSQGPAVHMTNLERVEAAGINIDDLPRPQELNVDSVALQMMKDKGLTHDRASFYLSVSKTVDTILAALQRPTLA